MKWITWEHPEDHLGFLPLMFSDDDPRPAREQANDNYQHGGGWHPRPGFTLLPTGALCYPGDPPMFPLAQAMLRDEKIVLYPFSWVVIKQTDGSFEVARMD